jgi:ribose 5-phosphate isomerase RpiB
MTLGSQVTGAELAKSLVKIWMESEYVAGGRSQPKIQRIYDYAGDSSKEG